MRAPSGRFRVCGCTLNDLLAYQTPKLVSVRDSTVGGLYYILLIAVFLYLIIFQVFYNLGYLEFRQPEQNVRLSLKQPTVDECDPLKNKACQDVFPPAKTLDYCCRSECASATKKIANASPNASLPSVKENACVCPWNPHVHTYECEYLDGTRASTVNGNTLLVQTRFGVYEESRKSCSNTDCIKRWEPVGLPRIRTVAGIENFTMTIDHSVLLKDYGIMKDNQEMSGFLHVKGKGPQEQSLCRERPDAVDKPLDGKPIDTAPCFITPRSKPGIKMDIFYISTLMRAMGVDVDNTSSFDGNETRRSEGFTVSIQIEYINTRKFWGVFPDGQVIYIYHLDPAVEGHYNNVETIWKQFPDSRYQVVKYGILFTVSGTGLLGAFSCQQVLMTLTTGVVFLGICSIIIKHTATKLLSKHEYYSHYLIEESVSFSDIAHLQACSDEDLQKLLVSRELKTKGTRKAQIIRILKDGFTLEDDDAEGGTPDEGYGTMPGPSEPSGSS